MKSVSKWPKEHKINTQRLRRVTSTQRLRRVYLGRPKKDSRQNALLTFAFWAFWIVQIIIVMVKMQCKQPNCGLFVSLFASCEIKCPNEKCVKMAKGT